MHISFSIGNIAIYQLCSNVNTFMKVTLQHEQMKQGHHKDFLVIVECHSLFVYGFLAKILNVGLKEYLMKYY